MILGIGTEGEIFLYAALAGITVLCAYNILMLFRRLIRHSASVTGAEDVIFWIGASVYIFCKMYDTTYGAIRWFFVIGLLCGAGAARLLIRLVSKILAKIEKSLEKYKKKS